MYNKYITRTDLDTLKTKYAHHLNKFDNKKDDSLFKNLNILSFVEDSITPNTNKKVIDIGGGHSPLGMILTDLFENVYCVDLEFSNKNVTKNIVVRDDFFNYIKNHNDGTFDYMVDSCALTHFAHNSQSNIGLETAAQLIYNKLKPGGYFVMSTDVLPHTIPDTYNQKEFIYSKEIIEIFEKQNFKLTSTFDYDSIEPEHEIHLDYHGKCNMILNYCSLIFKKPE